MTVFKGFMVMVKRNLHTFIMYIAIFLSVCVFIQIATKGKGLAQFEETSLNIAVMNEDGGTLSKNLETYLGQRHHLVEIENNKNVIQEELFYRNIYYVLTIPEDFEASFIEGTGTLQTTKLPGTNSAFYVDQQINTFLNKVKVFLDVGFGMEEALAKANNCEEKEANITLLDKNGYGGQAAPHSFMFQYMPYIMLSILCYVLSYIMITYRKKDLRRRILCSPVSSKRQNSQLVLGYLILGMGLWVICMILPVIMYGKEFLTDKNILYYGANAFFIMLVSLSAAFLIGVIVENELVVNGIVNVITLGMSFTCGVFVPLAVLGKGVRTVSQFLPVYWYEIVNEIIANNVNFTPEQRGEIFKGFGIQFLFAVAILSLGLVVSKYKEQE